MFQGFKVSLFALVMAANVPASMSGEEGVSSSNSVVNSPAVERLDSTAKSAACLARVEETSRGLLFHFGQAEVELAVVNQETLRLSVATGGGLIPAPSSFLVVTNSDSRVKWEIVKQGAICGIRTPAGVLLMNPRNGQWTLENSKGEVLIPQHEIGGLAEKDAADKAQVSIELGWDKHKPITVYGSGNGVDELQQTKVATGVSNGVAVIPYYWANAGYAVLAVTANDNRPAFWRGAKDGKSVTWTFPGQTADLYLMPAATLKAAAGAYARLTGPAPVPPRWAFGYLQSRWGWKNRAYIEDTLKHFRELNIPLDAFIFDFEWYTAPDYQLPPKGAPDFDDFGWNTNLFSDPVGQIRDYKEQGVRFVGIRKPRLGNSNSLLMIRTNQWKLDADIGDGSAYHARDVDFRSPGFRKWYAEQSASLLTDGVEGWWNDEGEGSFTTYYYWNLAERETMDRYEPGQRLWSLNRAFSPGTQRLGAAAWTGDIKSSWKTLAKTPASLLNWSLAGMPYNTCDIGGFFGTPTPELLSRWLEAGIFIPFMRTHSHHDATPHFPWLYGAEAQDAMRRAIELRYRLIPYYYSLAHETFETGLPLMRPLVMEFPGDLRVANMFSEWMVGSSLLAAPILEPGGQRSVYLPAGDWYVFGTNQMIKGARTIKVKAALNEVPLYVRAGTILPLGPIIQHTGQMLGGALELQIYPGKDASFTLVEDDGETTGYLNGKMRRTTFQWNNATGQLSWKVAGDYSGKEVFQNLHVVLFNTHGCSEANSHLDEQGTLKLPALDGKM